MDDKLNKLLLLDQEIGDFLYENENLNDNEIALKFEEKKFVDRAIKILKKLSNNNVIELLKRARYLTNFIDLKKFIKKYPLNKSKLKKNKELFIEEYKKLQKTCFFLSDIAIDYKEFREYMDVLDIDNVEKYLLENMPNDQIYKLSLETGIWDEKLFYFSFLKNNKKKKAII